MHKLMDYICKELEELERKTEKGGKLSMAEIEYVDKLAHIKKSLLAAEEMWDDSEYSQDGGQRNSYRTRDGRRSSYTRGRSYTTRRDGMGRYSSAEADDMAQELRELIQDAPDQQTRQDIQRIITRLEQM